VQNSENNSNTRQYNILYNYKISVSFFSGIESHCLHCTAAVGRALRNHQACKKIHTKSFKKQLTEQRKPVYLKMNVKMVAFAVAENRRCYQH